MIDLREHQQQATRVVFEQLRAGVDKQLLCLPTGTGKTILALAIAQQFERVLFLVHGEELLQQTIAAYEHFGESPGVIHGKRHEIGEHLTVGMLPTVYARLDKVPRDAFELVVIDEAAHATAKTWRTVAEHFSCELRLGLSATPERMDGADLSNLFSTITYSLPLKQAVDDGLLVRPRTLAVYTHASLDNVGKVAGDFNQGQLDKCVNTEARNQLIVESYQKHATGRRAVIFCTSIQHACDLSEMLREEGIKADYVYGSDPARAEKIAALRSGSLEALANAMVLTEGFDAPAVNCIVLARPTQSRPLMAQMIGRGLRLSDGKTDCLIVDVVDNTSRHNLVTAWEFFGHPKRAAAGVVDDPYLERDRLDERVVRAQDRYHHLTGQWEDETTIERWIDVLTPPPESDGFSYGAAPWHHQPATEKQLQLLQRYGYDIETTDWTKRQASQAINQQPAWASQLRQLLDMGFDVLTENWTVGQANRILKPQFIRQRDTEKTD